MKKMLIGTLVAASAVLSLSGCQHPSTGDGTVYDIPTVTASTVAPTPSATPSASVTAAPKPSVGPTQAPTQSAKPSSTATPSSDSAASKALSQLASLTVAEADYSVDYNRTKDFGPAWEDVDGNGCDTRNDILKRDLTDIVYREDDPTCTIASGTLADPYTGRSISFLRGQSTSSLTQIDHLVPLHLAALHGAEKWTQERREAYANDPFVLLAVDGRSNSQKSDKGPADWLPSNEAYHCTYVEKFIAVEAKYDLTISRRDAATSRSILADCK